MIDIEDIVAPNNPNCPECGHTLWMDSGRWKCTLNHCYSYEDVGPPREMV